jgi:hypothetical protein
MVMRFTLADFRVPDSKMARRGRPSLRPGRPILRRARTSAWDTAHARPQEPSRLVGEGPIARDRGGRGGGSLIEGDDASELVPRRLAGGPVTPGAGPLFQRPWAGSAGWS